MSIPTMQEGEVGIVFRFYLKEDGNPFDVSGADSIVFAIEGNGERDMVVENAGNGQVKYITATGDFTTGTHEAQVILTYDGPLPADPPDKVLKTPVFLIVVSPAVRS